LFVAHAGSDSLPIDMDLNKSNVDFFSIEPPKLEDAGLEDPALPIEGIQVLLLSMFSYLCYVMFGRLSCSHYFWKILQRRFIIKSSIYMVICFLLN
jgi:hypothetical protein